ncbi:tudor domain-containing protein 5-like [Aricia agestis]|uniref:tudor domain-containing protein 5-like n=1 Tax=Aricia agestis TaxID=91739 RepID=UPI001C20424F|nr:tudor domain-containing protein 5-like [Aricia agestis]
MEEELKQLKTVLRSLVVSSPSQVDVRSLMRDYRDMMGQQIPLSKFGFRDPVSFLKKHFADCFLFQGPDSNPTLTLIVPETLKHIDQFVQRQKPSHSAKIKGKRRSVNETVLKQSTPTKNLIATTYQVQKTIDKETPIYKKPTEQNRTFYKTEPVRSESKNEINYTNNVMYKNKSTNDSAFKTQTNIECKSDDQRRPKTNPVHTVHEDSEQKNYRTPKTSTSDKENDAVSDQCHSSAYLNFLKKRMPFVNVNQTERTDCSDTEDSYSARPLSSSTSSSKRAQLEELQRELSEMILQEPGGILCTELMRKYRQRYGRELEFARFGYTSVLSVVVTLPDCAAHALHEDWLLTDARAPPPRPTPRPPHRAPPRATPTDPEDALPFTDFEPDVFPPDCMHYMDSIPPADLGAVDAGDMLEVMVGEVYSPSHFWLIRLGQEYDIAMENLMDEMNEYFKSGEGQSRRLALGAVRAGHYCCSCYCGDWHRSLIVKVLDSDTVKVRHVDYGTVETVRATELRPLLRVWAELPAQAVRARLAAAAPPAAARRWPRAAAARFLTAVTDKRLVANVVARDHQEDILEVVLVDTSTEEDVSIGELLVRAGHADPRAAPATGSDAAYLYPLFGVLEAGDTPNYAEIQAYLRNGIALDYVEDYRRHVPAAAPPRPPPTALVSPRPAPAPPADPPPAAKPAPAASPGVATPPASAAPPPSSPAYAALASAASASTASISTAPAPAAAAEPDAVTLSAADCEVFALLSQMDAVVAQRFIMWAIQRRQNTSATPLNPLAPEFPAPSRTPVPPVRPATPATPVQPDTSTAEPPAPPVTPAPPHSSPVTPAPSHAERSFSVQAINGLRKPDPGAGGGDGRASAPPAPGACRPGPPRPPPVPAHGGYAPEHRFASSMVFGPRFSLGWGQQVGYGPPQPPAGFGPPQPPAGYGSPQPPAGFGPPHPPAGFGPPYPPAVYAPPAPPHAAYMRYANLRPPPGFERFY